jgi:hypothetical protein
VWLPLVTGALCVFVAAPIAVAQSPQIRASSALASRVRTKLHGAHAYVTRHGANRPGENRLLRVTLPVQAGRCYALVAAARGAGNASVSVMEGSTIRTALSLGHVGAVERALYCPSASQHVTIATVVAGAAEFAIAFAGAP